MSDINLDPVNLAEAIASAWYQAILDSGESDQDPKIKQLDLLDITRQIISLSCEDQFQTEAARAIGECLAQLGYKHVDAIGRVPAILSRFLTQGLEPDQINVINTRLANVLAQVIDGFVGQQYKTALVEKERALQAYETEWIRINADRQEIEQKSQAILQAIPDTLGIATLDGEVLYYHPGSERIAFYSRDTKLKNIREYLTDELAEELLAVYKQVVESGQPRMYEYSATFDKIGKLYYQDLISPYTGNTVLVISRDITKQKRIEEDLRASEARYRSIVEDQIEYIARWTPGAIMTFVNQAVCTLMGMDYEQIIGSDFDNFIRPIDEEESQKLFAAFATMTPEHPISQGQMHALVHNQYPLWLEWKTRATFNDQGEAIEFQTVANDITDVKRAQDELRESEERYRSVVEGQTELIARFLADGRITFVNEAFCRFFSRSRQEFLGSSALNLVHEEDQHLIAQSLDHLQNNSSQDLNKPYQTRVILASGEIRWVESITSAITRPDGSFSEFQVVARDVNELKLAQETLEQQNELLHQLSDQLINIQEIERQRIARDLHDSVLNELGAMIIAPAESLTPQKVREKNEKMIEELRQTINGLRSPMLNYGLYAALEDLGDTFLDNPQLAVKFEIDIPASLARFDSTVELHLFRIIQQACDNAIQHAQAHQIRVFGRIDENCITLCVEDDGKGFQLGAEMDLAHILAQKHFGLVSMLERGKLIGADVHISSCPGAGTQVQVHWELQNNGYYGDIL
jgi:PAS domain S-box-containing protein